MVSQVCVMGGAIGLIIFGAWILFTNVMNMDLVVARSLVMALMVFMQNVHAINSRSETRSTFKISILKKDIDKTLAN